MTHPVLTDADFTAPITLRHEDGTETETRGQLTRAPEREGLAETQGRLEIQAGTPANKAIVLTIEAMNGIVYDVTRTDPRASGLGSTAFKDWDSVSYVVRRRP